MLKLIAVGLAALTLAFGQTEPAAGESNVSPVTTPPANWADKFLGLVRPTDLPPLTEKKRFQIYLFNTVGPIPVLSEAGSARVAQWMGSPPEWGNGWNGFGKRYGTSMLFNGVRQTITYGGSIALREDNRYYVSGAKGFWGRARHALVNTVLARRPDGRQVVGVSGIAGIVGASALQSLWGPPSWKGTRNIAEVTGLSFASTAGSLLVLEFLPELLGRPR